MPEQKLVVFRNFEDGHCNSKTTGIYTPVNNNIIGKIRNPPVSFCNRLFGDPVTKYVWQPVGVNTACLKINEKIGA
jgi:hypothetical protein